MDDEALTKTQAILGLAVGILVVAFLGWCQHRPDPGPDIVELRDVRDRAQWDVPEDARATVEQAVQNYLSFCRIRPHELSDIQQLRITLVRDLDQNSYWTEAYGWRDRVDVSFKVRDNVKGRAAGHRLTYHLGGGGAAGVVSMKSEATQYCYRLLGGENGENLFGSAPKMKVLDRLH
jgi:hypothetical protein